MSEAKAGMIEQFRVHAKDTGSPEVQIALLSDWRSRKAAGDETGADALLPELLLSINAIASGLRTTG